MEFIPTEISYGESAEYSNKRFFIFQNTDMEDVKALYREFLSERSGRGGNGIIDAGPYFVYPEDTLFHDGIIPADRKRLEAMGTDTPGYILTQSDYRFYMEFPRFHDVRGLKKDEKRDKFMRDFAEFLWKNGVPVAEHQVFQYSDEMRRCFDEDKLT
jgi:hypothetical protein